MVDLEKIILTTILHFRSNFVNLSLHTTMGQYQISSMGCGARCLKMLLALLNIIFLIAGLAIAIIAGIAAFNKNSKIHQMLAAYDLPQLNYGLYTLFAVGLVLAIVSFIGMWGTIAENTCLLFVYFLFLFIVVVAQLTGVIVCFVEGNKIERKLIDELKKKPPAENNTDALLYSAVLHAAIEAVEEKYHCCGITGPSNYGDNPLPLTCYAPAPSPSPSVAKRSTSMDEPSIPIQTTTTLEPPTPPHGPLYTIGCIDTVKPQLLTILGIAIAIMLLEVLVLIFTCCLMSAINDQYTPV